MLFRSRYLTVQTREMVPPYNKLPKDRWAQADEWSLLWKFDQGRERDSFPFEFRLFHVRCHASFDDVVALPQSVPNHVHGTLTLQLDGTSEGRTFVNFLNRKV